MPTFLIPLIPFLVTQAESLLAGKSGSEKRDWVHDAVKELEPFLKRVEPAWLEKSLDSQEELIDMAIQFALDKIAA